ncbi:hypothetical protein KB236_11640 [Levilactobacillus brevis]|nr:hypothetical protein KB236_11640 [Levilactobacillus brevis]
MIPHNIVADFPQSSVAGRALPQAVDQIVRASDWSEFIGLWIRPLPPSSGESHSADNFPEIISGW